MKFFHLILSLLFLLFAIVQWNDPDSILWILLYLVISAIAFLAFWGWYNYRIYFALSILLVIPTAFYLPHVVSWIQDEMPGITKTMKASSPYVELVREFFGLLISLITLIFYLILAKKNKV